MKVAEARDGDIILRIHRDGMAESPREMCDELGTMVCWHPRYNLGDKHDYRDPQEFQEWLKDNPAVVLSLYLYDHSGITMSTGRAYPFGCQWDSMQVGYIYCTHERMKEECNPTCKGEALIKECERMLECEVKEYDQYLTGDVYGFELIKVAECEYGHEHEVDDLGSCWGFYGRDWKENGMMEHVEEEYEYLFDRLEDC